MVYVITDTWYILTLFTDNAWSYYLWSPVILPLLYNCYDNYITATVVSTATDWRYVSRNANNVPTMLMNRIIFIYRLLDLILLQSERD